MKQENHCCTVYLDSIDFSEVRFISVYITLCNYTLCLMEEYQTKEQNNLIYKGEPIK